MNVRRAPRIVVVAPGILSWPNRHKSVAAFGIGHRMPAATEIRIERRVVLVALVKIATCGVGLPDFDKCVSNGSAVFIQHPAAYHNAFTHRLARMLFC